MNDLDQSEPLHDLLDRVACPHDDARGATPVTDDLGRARSAMRQRRRRTYSAGLGALTTLAVLGVGTATVVAGSDEQPGATPRTPAAPTTSAPTGDPGPTGQTRTPTPKPKPKPVEEVRLVAQPMEAGPYTFGTTPEGWELQNNEPFAVTIGRVGETNRDPASFVGKLVILLDDLPLGNGERVVRDGREMVFRANVDGYVTAAVATRPGEPQGTVRVQFPADLGWSRDAALTFLSSVVVGPDAEVVHG